MIYKDIKLGYKLLKREGTKQFIYRAILYIQGQRLLADNQKSKGESLRNELINSCGVLEFPLNPKPPLVSIIIPAYNQWGYTYACLASILKNSGEIAYETIVLDDFSTDDTRNVEQFVRNIKVVRNERNMGFLFSCNKAAKMASGKYIVLLNNDTLVQPEWLMWLIKTLEEKPDVGLVGSKLLFSNGKLQEAGGIVFRDGTCLNYGRDDDPDKPEYNYFKDVDYCSGASICIRKLLWTKLGGFDMQFIPAYYEDADLAFAIRNIGYRTVYQPKSIVIHFENISHGKDIHLQMNINQAKNHPKFIEKWAKNLGEYHFRKDENNFLARDKSMFKKTIIIFDRYVPDQYGEEEDVATYRTVLHFISLNYNIKVIPGDFIRRENSASIMEQHGVEVLYGNWYKKHWLTWMNENAGNINTICFADHKLAEKYLPSLKKIFKKNLSYFIITENF
jgi:GT2 family glycosyltransferase